MIWPLVTCFFFRFASISAELFNAHRVSLRRTSILERKNPEKRAVAITLVTELETFLITLGFTWKYLLDIL